MCYHTIKMLEGDQSMKCPVCGKRYTATICPDCGFDDSRNYERYPTFGQISGVPSISARRRRWNDRTADSKSSPGRHPFLTAVACAAILMLGIWIGVRIGSSEPTETPETTAPPITTAPPETTTTPESTAPSEPGWEANLLRADPVPYQSDDEWDWDDEAKVFPVFGSGYRREQIASVTFLDTLSDAPEDAWDVTAAGDGRVMAWVTPSKGLYDLYIAAEGGVSAANACSDLFAGYSNAKTIHFGEAFHTTGAADMSCMFLGCKALTGLNLNRFDTSAVQDISYMFSWCLSLKDLTLGDSFDTSAVQDMSYMFYYCKALTELNLSSFDTSAVQDMSYMFRSCSSLTDLTLGDSFVTDHANTFNMFSFCPAGADYQHLLN